MSSELIELPKVTKAQLDAIVDCLNMGYTKKLKKAQSLAYRPVKINEELREYQIVLQEMLTTAKIYEREKANAGAGLATPDREGN